MNKPIKIVNLLPELLGTYGDQGNVATLSWRLNQRGIKNELINTASSHNKNIYFKNIIEHYNLNLSILNILNKIYWEEFYNNISNYCYDGIRDFIIWNKKKVCFKSRSRF